MFRMVGRRIRTDVISLLASPLSARGALTMGLLAAGAFVVLSSINITAQGLYYDEIHQVPAALAYVSKRPPYFAMARVGGKPLMTMAYSGAIKSAVYGLYLSFTGSSFTVESWRRLGIAIVAVALPLFSLLARRRLTGATLLIFFGFLLTDATVVLETRHDWGPVALALALRLGFLGVWLYRQGDREIPPRNSLMLGAIVGFSIYEKLSAIVLLPVLVILLCCPERRTARHWGACLIGGLLGGLPLLIANGLYIAETGRLLSTAQVAMQGDKALAGMTYFGREYFALGDGAMVRQCILGEAHRFVVPEAILLVAALSAVLALRWTERSDPRPAILIACYLAVGIGIFLLPNRTGPYHWVIGTPFQYLALSMALVSPDRPRVYRPRLALAFRAALVGVVCVLMVDRAQGTLELVDALRRGASSRDWDPSLTRLGELAAQRVGRDRFIAGNWGVAMQIYCLSGGNPNLMREVLSEPSDAELTAHLDPDRFRSVYLVLKSPQVHPDPSVTRRLIAAIERQAYLREVPVESEFARLAAVKVRKFECSRRPYTAEHSPAPDIINRVALDRERVGKPAQARRR